MFDHLFIPAQTNPREKSRNTCDPVGIWCLALVKYLSPSFLLEMGTFSDLIYRQTEAPRGDVPYLELPRDLWWIQDWNLHSLTLALHYESPLPRLCVLWVLGD